MDPTAARSPCWSRSALPRGGGPCGRIWRKGRSQRRTVSPDSQNATASATRSGDPQFAPAPCVRTRQSPPEPVGRCRNPRMGASFGAASKKSRQLFMASWRERRSQHRLRQTLATVSRESARSVAKSPVTSLVIFPAQPFEQPDIGYFPMATRLATALSMSESAGCHPKVIATLEG